MTRTDRLAGKVALVTGGASGIGAAIAIRLMMDGAQVFISDIQREAGKAFAARQDCAFIEQDVSSEAQWGETMARVLQEAGKLDILVNNAGILGPMDAISPADTRFEDWKRLFAINVDGVFLGCKAALAVMRPGEGGSIINISSVAALLASPYATAYGATKAAVRHLTKSVAQYCAERRLGIRCNSIHPGNVRTPLYDAQAVDNARLRGITPDELFAEAAQRIPLGDFTRPEDIAAAVSFLASDDARHMTGAKLVVDGGLVHCDTFAPVQQSPGR